MILIETYTIGLLYYSDKLPVYLFETGKIINPILANNLNINRFILNIDPIIVKIFGLRRYINSFKIIHNNNYNHIEYRECIDDINNNALYLLKIMFMNKLSSIINSNNIKLFIKYYDLLDYFKDKIKDTYIFESSNNNHNRHNIENDIYQLTFYTHLPLQKYNFKLNYNKIYINTDRNIYLPLLIQIYRDYLNENIKNNDIIEYIDSKKWGLKYPIKQKINSSVLKEGLNREYRGRKISPLAVKSPILKNQSCKKNSMIFTGVKEGSNKESRGQKISHSALKSPIFKNSMISTYVKEDSNKESYERKISPLSSYFNSKKSK